MKSNTGYPEIGGGAGVFFQNPFALNRKERRTRFKLRPKHINKMKQGK